MTYPPTRNSGPNPPVNQTLPYGPPPPIEKHRLNKKSANKQYKNGSVNAKIIPSLSYLKRKPRYRHSNLDKPLTKRNKRPPPILPIVTNQPSCCAKECTIDTSNIPPLYTPASPFWLLSKLVRLLLCHIQIFSLDQ